MSNDLIYRLLKSGKTDELKTIINEGEYFAGLKVIFKQLEDNSLEDLIAAYEKKEPLPEAAVPDSPEITNNDLAYRFRKAIKEPKRIFEAHQPYKKPGKKNGR